jgi:glutamate--cysteine ligase
MSASNGNGDDGKPNGGKSPAMASSKLAGVQRDLIHAGLTDRSGFDPIPCDFLKPTASAADGDKKQQDSKLSPCARDWTRAIEPEFAVGQVRPLFMGIELETFMFDAESLQPLGDAGAAPGLNGQFILQEIARRYESSARGTSNLIQDHSDPRAQPVTYGLFLSEGISYSLEPGGQLEIATPPRGSLSETRHCLRRAFELVEEVTANRVRFLSHGTNPVTTAEFELQVPKKRYRILSRYLGSEKAGRGIDMMRHATTVQPNIDVGPDHASWVEAVRLTNELSPIFKMLFPNSFFFRNRFIADGMERQRIWSNLDRSRTGIPPAILQSEDPACCYAQWATQAFVFLIEGLPESEQPVYGELRFCDWMAHGYKGTQPGLADWERHLATLFPELRLRGFLELRMFDSQPYGQIIPLLALVRGLLQSPLGRKAVLADLGICKEMLEAGRRAPLFDRLLAAARIGLSDHAGLGGQAGLGGENDSFGPAILKALVLPDPERFARFGDARAFVKSESVLSPSIFFATVE